MKLELSDLLLAAGYDAVFFEQRGCDLLALKETGSGIAVMGVEIERSVRNVVRNVTRDLEQGCGLILVVAVGTGMDRAVARKLDKGLDNTVRQRTHVVSRTDLTVENLMRLKVRKEVDSEKQGV
jgi:hypothetical protein